MAQITTVALPQYTIPKKKPSQQARSVTMDFTPTSFTTDVTTGDNILIATIQKDAQLISAGVRLAGAVGAAGCFVQLRLTENSVTSVLTEPLAATYSGSAVMSAAPPQVNPSYVKTIELLVGGGSIDHAVTTAIEITYSYSFYKLAG